MSVRWEAAGATNVGRVRKGNEDSYLLDAEHGVFVVADGMGGHAAGEIASALAVECVGCALLEGVKAGGDADSLTLLMAESFAEADRAVYAHVAAHPETSGMGTTVTASVVRADGALRVGHIGDSRAYLLRMGRLAQLTRDHTWVQREVAEGRLTPSAARRHPLAHILTRALGADNHEHPDLLGGELLPGDQLLLCTDGLTGMVPDREITRLLLSQAAAGEVVESLIAAANQRGGRDNSTAILVRILEEDG